MYAKIISFLQGSDNQVVLQAASMNGIRKIVMPFTSPYFIYCTLKYKNNFREICNPKYFVRDITKKYFQYERYTFNKKNHVSVKVFDMEGFEESFNVTYEQHLNRIIKGEYLE